VTALLDPRRPPALCPGCSHERSLHALDRAFGELGLEPHEVVLVSDIGCSGLFDTFFATHAFHGLHGRALTYAAGIRLARPDIKVVVTMGDGGLGIGGAHFLAACRRNLDLTLLVLNNFNFGMTGGQFSCTTPREASVASGFLNTLEQPLDICRVAAAAGAPFVARSSVYRQDLSRLLVQALEFEGFAVVDQWGVCTGHYRRQNPLTPGEIEQRISALAPFEGPVEANLRRRLRCLLSGSGRSCRGRQE
jgi:2-oxoglutarate/2-oxoacid ferredoxin oxidoreductase subunit beta